MAAKTDPDRFVTDPIPSEDDGSVTEYQRNVDRIRRETDQNPPAERAQ